jgi:hypothetical protein
MNDNSWQQLLIGSNPHLFIRSFRGLPFAPGYPSCPDGWREIVVTMVERVSFAARGYPVQFTQISQKFGTLRIYWIAEATLPKPAERAVEESIALAEARSACTCAKCGAAGRLFCAGGLLLPACPAHVRGEPLPARGGLENVYFLREIVGDDISVIACRRYDRARDAFIDLDFSSDGR